MVVRIIIAGAGHGGLVAGTLLARQGLDVSIHEQRPRDALGHDWHDDFYLEAFDRAGLPRPPPSDFTRKGNIRFHSPSMAHVLSTYVPEHQLEIQMDRRVLYGRLLALAEDAGVKLYFNSHVDGPLLEGHPGVVRGLVIGGKETSADLVIDAAGLDSPVRRGLPDRYRVQRDINPPDVFNTYRAYYNLQPGKPYDSDRFEVYFLFGGLRGIAWFRVVDGQADIFFGQVEPLAPARVDELLLAMRREHPALGETRTRGGQFNAIPIRHQLSRFVGDGYAAVGDAACMAVPLNGSGIHNAMVAGAMLADAVKAAIGEAGATPFPARALWPYQAAYLEGIGARMVGIDYLKRYLLALPAGDLDFIFAKRLITEKEVIAASAGNEIEMGFRDIMGKLARGFKRLPLLLSLKAAVDRMKKAVATASRIPTTYDPEAIDSWEAALERSMHHPTSGAASAASRPGPMGRRKK
ncbi:MAG: NAD(P)/FAD-dependent oxidoreductase [Candidatus Lokiarchaeota archaeon]|nr:NAD(P)/FAD-dependent oxidoreductase [Candidatus Lokiarchaeota archaeon]